MSASSDRMEDEPANDKFEDENGDKIDDWERDPFDALLESAPEWVLCETLRNLGEDDADDLAVHVMAVFNPWEDVDSEDTEDEDPPPGMHSHVLDTIAVCLRITVAPSAKKRKTEPVATDDNDAGQSEPGHENEDEDEDDIDDHTEGNPVEIEVTEEGYRQQLVDDFLKDAPAPALRKAIASLCEYSGRRGWATSSLTNLYHDFDRTVCQGLVRHGKRPWTETCAGCKQTYDEALNEMGSCSFFRWHCGKSDITSTKRGALLKI